MIQTVVFNPIKGSALPMPDWFKVVNEKPDEITIEGDIPNDPKSNRRNRRVQLVFKFAPDGSYHRLCLRRIKGEWEHWNTKVWEPYSQGGRVLTTRMLSNLITAKTGDWW